MGSSHGNNIIGNPIPENRRREFMILFYLVLTFVSIRVWIIVISTGKTIAIVLTGIATIFVIVLLILRYRYLRRVNRQRNLERDDNSNNFNNGQILLHIQNSNLNRDSINGALPKEIVDSLFTYNYKATKITSKNIKNDNNNDDILINIEGVDNNDPNSLMYHNDKYNCIICLDDYIEDDLIIQLPCSHCYHKRCINSWFERQQTCPLCKQNIQTLTIAQDNNNNENSTIFIGANSNNNLTDNNNPITNDNTSNV